jgi:hypothetical protein
VTADEGHPPVAQQPMHGPPPAGVPRTDQHHGGGDRDGDAHPAVEVAVAGRPEQDVRRQCGHRDDRHPAGSIAVDRAAERPRRTLAPHRGSITGGGRHPQRQRRPDQQLGETCGRAEVEPVRRQRQRTGVEHRRRDQTAAGEPPRVPPAPARDEHGQRPEQVEVPLDRERPGVREGVQRGDPETALLRRCHRRRGLRESHDSTAGDLPGGKAGRGDGRVEQHAADDETEQRRVEPHDPALQEAAPRVDERARPGGAPQERGDDEAAEHEEDVDADGAAVEERDVPGEPVQRQHSQDRDGAKAVEVVDPTAASQRDLRRRPKVKTPDLGQRGLADLSYASIGGG